MRWASLKGAIPERTCPTWHKCKEDDQPERTSAGLYYMKCEKSGGKCGDAQPVLLRKKPALEPEFHEGTECSVEDATASGRGGTESMGHMCIPDLPPPSLPPSLRTLPVWFCIPPGDIIKLFEGVTSGRLAWFKSSIFVALCRIGDTDNHLSPDPLAFCCQSTKERGAWFLCFWGFAFLKVCVYIYIYPIVSSEGRNSIPVPFLE